MSEENTIVDVYPKHTDAEAVNPRERKHRCEMNTMKQAKQVENFELVLLSYVDLCYAVALALTRNQDDACNLTRDVMTWAWNLRDSSDSKTGMKMRLLTALRERFLQHYRRPELSLAGTASDMT